VFLDRTEEGRGEGALEGKRWMKESSESIVLVLDKL